MNHRYFLFALVLLLPGLAQAQTAASQLEPELIINSPADIAACINNSVFYPTEFPEPTCYPIGGEYVTPDTSLSVLIGVSLFTNPSGGTGEPTGVVYPEDPVTGDVAFPTNLGACEPIGNPGDIAGKVAFISRGDDDGTGTGTACSFFQKGVNAMDAGAIAVVIYNNEDRPADTIGNMVGGDDPPDRFLDIPLILITRGEAQPIINQQKFGNTVNVTLRRLCSDVDPTFCQSPVAIEPGPDGTPGTHALSTANPNPFNGRTSFSLEVAQVQNVSVEVFNALGQRVAVLHQGAMTPGTAHTFTLNATDLPSGVYFYRATGETFSETRSLVLAR